MIPIQPQESLVIGWHPQEDITVYELATALPLLIHGLEYTPALQLVIINALPPSVARHFTGVSTETPEKG